MHLYTHLFKGPFIFNSQLKAYIIKNRNPVGKLLLKPKYKGIVAIFLFFRYIFKDNSSNLPNWKLFQEIILRELDDNVMYEFTILVRINAHNVIINNYRDMSNDIIDERRKAIVSKKLRLFVNKERFRDSEYARLFWLNVILSALVNYNKYSKFSLYQNHKFNEWAGKDVVEENMTGSKTFIPYDYITLIFKPIGTRIISNTSTQTKSCRSVCSSAKDIDVINNIKSLQNYRESGNSYSTPTSTEIPFKAKGLSLKQHIRNYSFYTQDFKLLKDRAKPFAKGAGFSLFSTQASSSRSDLPDLEMFPEDLVDILKLRLKKTCKDKEIGEGWNHSEMMTVLLNIQKLMKNAEFAVDKGRTGVLDNRSWFLRAVLSIVKYEGYDTWEKQLAIEMLSLHYESKFISEMLKDMQANGLDKSSGMMYKLFHKSLPTLIEAIQAILTNAEYKGLTDFKGVKDAPELNGRVKLLLAIYLLGADNVASIVFSNLVRISGSGGGAEEMNIIHLISEAIFIHMKHQKKFATPAPKEVMDLWESNRENILISSIMDRIEVGQTLLDICLQCCHELFEKNSKVISRTEKESWVVIKKEFLVYLSNFVFNPIRLPMLHQPNDWSVEETEPKGGYLHKFYNELVNSEGLVHQPHDARYQSVVSEDQIKAVNYLNCQKFEIHGDMLDYLLKEWKDDNGLFGKYNKPCEDESFNPESQMHNSLYWMYRNILNIAELFRDQVFYLPVFMDFRGRIYPLANYLSYQGGDIARSLLSFHRTSYRPGDNKHILIYLCNVFGNNSYSMNSRIKWSETNLPRIISLFDNDRSTFIKEYLDKANEKAQFLSCVLELRKAHLEKKGDYNRCKLPVLFDATCSGMQHLSALTTNIDLAALVNLTGGDLQDFYNHCAEVVSSVIANHPNKAMRKQLAKVKISRKLVKLPVMTIPYNIGLESLTEKITAKFEKYFIEEQGKMRLKFLVPVEYTVNSEPLILTGSEAGTLGAVIYRTVKGLMPPIQQLKDYFSGFIVVLSKVNKPIFWITPAGMKIWGSSVLSETKRVKTSFLRNSKPVTIRIPTDNYDYKTINRSLMANLIHSLDAANIHYLIKIITSDPEWNQNHINLYTIHDCFASVNDQMDLVETFVRKAFSALYFEKNYLVELDACLLNQIKSYGVDIQTLDNGVRLAAIQRESGTEIVEIPKLPAFNWDVNKDYLKKQIIYAEYFIS